MIGYKTFLWQILDIASSIAEEGMFKSCLRRTATGLMLVLFVFFASACANNSAEKVNIPNISHPKLKIAPVDEKESTRARKLGAKFKETVKEVLRNMDYTTGDPSVDQLLEDPNLEHEFSLQLFPFALFLNSKIKVDSGVPGFESTLDYSKQQGTLWRFFDSKIELNPEAWADVGVFDFSHEVSDSCVGMRMFITYFEPTSQESLWKMFEDKISRIQVYIRNSNGKIQSKEIKSSEENFPEYLEGAKSFLDYFKQKIKQQKGTSYPSTNTRLEKVVHEPFTPLDWVTPIWGLDEDDLFTLFGLYYAKSIEDEFGINVNLIYDDYPEDSEREDWLYLGIVLYGNKRTERGLVLRDFRDIFTFGKNVSFEDGNQTEKEEVRYLIETRFKDDKKFNIVILDSNNNLVFDEGDTYVKGWAPQQHPINDDYFNSFLKENTEYNSLDEFTNALNEFIEEFESIFRDDLKDITI